MHQECQKPTCNTKASSTCLGEMTRPPSPKIPMVAQLIKTMTARPPRLLQTTRALQIPVRTAGTHTQASADPRALPRRDERKWQPELRQHFSASNAASRSIPCGSTPVPADCLTAANACPQFQEGTTLMPKDVHSRGQQSPRELYTIHVDCAASSRHKSALVLTRAGMSSLSRSIPA